ncbi:TrkH family potassium uptake protein [Maridesulfovibrio ferrireducens]|uniref:TrkH family potassium uptake protein n=1 Tax=Maridesulfovibrio ferrireducens TaxID=246191 RepID=UPI001A300A1E|nr:potassium transporter TrkG [Maridesulfovibrio ferrireducens]MBI9110830.1 potassium transporter TrkH [Maridesulfovibrio ferrireducens]
MKSKASSPFWVPIYAFLTTIITGGLLLKLDICHPGKSLSLLDAIFTATSAVCVTGLAVVDTGSFFSRTGQTVILTLIQLGGLGIMTYASLVIYLLGKKVSAADRIAVSQTLIHDPSFNIGRFIVGVVTAVLSIELIGAVLLNRMDPQGFAPYSAIFHSVSAFCNAGFSLYPDSLSTWKDHAGINFVFIALIVMGGLGFYVLTELWQKLCDYIRRKKRPITAHPISWQTYIVLETTLFLIIAGTVALLLAESLRAHVIPNFESNELSALFQSVTCRTAGFNTLDISSMTNISLIFMIFLMLIGGSPGSCAGGLKTTTFRALFGFVISKIRGRSQVRVGWYALTEDSINKSLTIMALAGVILGTAVILLSITEGGNIPHTQARGHFIEILFETVSAFATVGLSTGITPKLTSAGKIIIISLMFVGRLGPVWLLTAINSWQSEPRYKVPEDDLSLG